MQLLHQAGFSQKQALIQEAKPCDQGYISMPAIAHALHHVAAKSYRWEMVRLK